MMYVKCPYCKKDFDVTDRMCGKIMNCPACKMSIKNPPQKPTSKSSYPHLQIEADNNPAPSVVNNTRQGSPSRVQDRQLDAEQAFQSMLDIKEAQLNRKKSPPPAGCGCLIAFGLALLSFAVGGAMQIEDSGMGYFSVVLLIVSTAGYIITYKKMKKKKDILLQNHSMEMKALVNRIYNSQPLIAQYVKSADELLNITCCDEIIAALQQEVLLTCSRVPGDKRSSVQTETVFHKMRSNEIEKVGASTESDNNISPVSDINDNLRSHSSCSSPGTRLATEQALRAILGIKEFHNHKIQLFSPAGCGCFVSVGLAMLSILIAGTMQIHDSGMGFFVAVIFMVSLAGFIITAKIMEKKKALQKQKHNMELETRIKAAFNRHPLITKYIKSVEELMNVNRCDEIIDSLKQDISLMAKASSLANNIYSRAQNEPAFVKHDSLGVKTGESSTEFNYGRPLRTTNPMYENVLRRIDVLDSQPDPVIPPICVITGDKAEIEMPVNGFTWDLGGAVPGYALWWNFKRETLLLPFSRHGYELYQANIPGLYKFIEAGFSVCYFIPLLPVDLVWWAVSIILFPLKIFSGEKRRLCAVHWKISGKKKFSLSVTSEHFASEFKKCNPWCRLYNTDTRKAGMFPF